MWGITGPKAVNFALLHHEREVVSCGWHDNLPAKDTVIFTTVQSAFFVGLHLILRLCFSPACSLSSGTGLRCRQLLVLTHLMFFIYFIK